MGVPLTLKKGVRMLGVAESFPKGTAKRSVLVGVVQRADLVIDGFSLAFPTVGGMDATDRLLELYYQLSREDVNHVCVSGSVISWYNVIDFNRFYETTKTPTVSLTYEPSEGLDEHFKRACPQDWRERLEMHKRNGARERVELHTGYEVFVRGYGVNTDEALRVLNSFLLQGKYPEPIKVARLISHQLSRALLGWPRSG
ncbi:MAG: DUF99 family protein [Candidatus Geothermarchaeales archaeon]